MAIRLIFDTQLCERIEVVVNNVPINVTERDVRNMFRRYIGIDYDENCSYEIVGCNNG